MHFCSPFLSIAIELSASTLLTINSTVNRLAQMERNGKLLMRVLGEGGQLEFGQFPQWEGLKKNRVHFYCLGRYAVFSMENRI